MDQALQLIKTLKLDSSLFVMMGIFIVAYWLCYAVFLKKLTGILVEREKRSEGRSENVDQLNEELHELAEKLKAQKVEVSKEAERNYTQVKNKALAEQSETLKTAKEKAASEVAAARAEVEKELRAESEKIKAEVPAIAKEIVNRLMNAEKKTVTAEGSELRTGV